MLIVRARGRACAIPLAQVRETMRPLPITSLESAPPFVLGVAVVRGEAVPVVDTGALSGAPATAPFPGRFVTLDLGGRRVCLAVDEVVAVREITVARAASLPPLLREAASGVVSALSTLDEELLFVLRDARIVPDDLGPLEGEGAGGA